MRVFLTSLMTLIVVSTASAQLGIVPPSPVLLLSERDSLNGTGTAASDTFFVPDPNLVGSTVRMLTHYTKLTVYLIVDSLSSYGKWAKTSLRMGFTDSAATTFRDTLVPTVATTFPKTSVFAYPDTVLFGGGARGSEALLIDSVFSARRWYYINIPSYNLPIAARGRIIVAAVHDSSQARLHYRLKLWGQ